jgi:hypothetical protein
LVVQAGPLSTLGSAALALAKFKGPMDEFQGLSYRTSRGKGPKIEGPIVLEFPCNGQVRIRALDVEAETWIPLVVFEDHVIVGAVFLDQIRFKEEGLLFRIGDEGVKACDLLSQDIGLQVPVCPFIEIGRNPFF